MNHIRWAIFHSLLIFLVLVGVKCADPSGSGLNAASCSPINGLNQDLEIDTDSYEGPVSLPVTIVKDIDGLDNPTLAFAAATQTISFYTIERTSCPTVGVYIGGEYHSSLTAITSDCLYTFTVTSDLIGTASDPIPIAFVVFGPGSTPTNGGGVSEPTIVQIIDTSDTGLDIDELPQYIIQVFVTNMALATADSTADILPTPNASVTLPARADEGNTEEHIIFAATDQDGLTYLWSLPVAGGAPEKLSTDPLDVTPLSFFNTYEGTAYVLNETGLSQIDSSGTLSAVDLPDLLTITEDEYNYQSFFAQDPGAPNYVVYVGNSDTGSLRPMFRDLNTDETCVFFEAGQSNDFSVLEIALLGQNKVVLAGRRIGEENYVLITFDLTDAILSVTDAPEGETYSQCNASFHVVENEGYVGHLVRNVNRGEYIYLVMETDDGSYELGLMTRGDELQQLTNFSANVRFPTATGDGGSLIAFELETTRRVGCFFSVETEEVNCPILGSKFAPLLTSPDIVPYIDRLNGYDQIALYNANLEASTALTIFPDEVTVPIDRSQDFIASGGTPPYTFSVETITGNGNVDTATGQLTATTQGTVNVIVTDTAGDTATATVTIPAPSTLDTSSFDVEGQGMAIALQTDSKVVVAGTAEGGGFLLARFSVDEGSLELDPEFGTNGVTTTVIGTEATATDVAIDSDGNIVACGEFVTDGSSDFVVARYTTNGVLDTSFGGGDGWTSTDFDDNNDHGRACAVSPGGKIYVAGTVTVDGVEMIALAKYLVNGTLDTEFGGDGLVTTTSNEWDASSATAVAIQTDGMVVVAGSSGRADNPDTFVGRYTSSGDLDTTFNTDGYIGVQVSEDEETAHDILIEDSYITVFGEANDPVTLKKIVTAVQLKKEDGSTHGNFAEIGILALPDPDGSSIRGFSGAVQDDGKYVIAGSMGDGLDTQGFMARFDADGSIDDRFGTDGMASFGTTEAFQDVVIMTDDNDKILAVGTQGDTVSLFSIWP